MLIAPDRLRKQNVIRDFRREFQAGSDPKGRIDLSVDLDDGRHWLELKYRRSSEQRDERSGPAFYFDDMSAVGAIEDVNKLRKISGTGDLWLLILNVVNPGSLEWDAGVRRFIRKFDIPIESHSAPSDYPPSYCLGLIKAPRW